MTQSTNEELIAMHICESCGAATERMAVNQESVFTGLIKCSNCGQERKLNIEIRGHSTKRPPERSIPPQG
jgi:transcription elongation factor Elf1